MHLRGGGFRGGVRFFEELGELGEVFAEGRQAADVVHLHGAEVFGSFSEDIGNAAVACLAYLHFDEHFGDVAG